MIDVSRDWENIYENKHTPWDVGESDISLVDFVESGLIMPCRTLELGCGNGNDAIFLSKNGFDVTAVDISKTAIETSRERAKISGVSVNFLAEDATELGSISGEFGFVFDRCTFHFIPEDRREKYLENLNKYLVSGGYFVLIVSSENDPVKGPYRFSKDDIRDFFGNDFEVLDIKLVVLEQHKLKPKPYVCLMRKK